MNGTVPASTSGGGFAAAGLRWRHGRGLAISIGVHGLLFLGAAVMAPEVLRSGASRVPALVSATLLELSPPPEIVETAAAGAPAPQAAPVVEKIEHRPLRNEPPKRKAAVAPPLPEEAESEVAAPQAEAPPESPPEPAIEEVPPPPPEPLVESALVSTNLPLLGATSLGTGTGLGAAGLGTGTTGKGHGRVLPAAGPLPTPPPPLNAPLITSEVAEGLRVQDSYALPDWVRLPAGVYVVESIVCIDANGAVDSIRMKRTATRELGIAVRRLMRDWKYRPYTVGGVPQPFCHYIELQYRFDT